MLTPSETGAREARERPIIFSAPMVRAILAGRKTQTRRVVRDTVPEAPGMDRVHPKNQIRHAAPYLDAYCGGPRTQANPRGMGDWWCWWTRDDRAGPQFKVGFKPGDRLWVKEGFARVGDNEDDIHACPDLRVHAYYRADDVCPEHSKWRSPIFMPRWASRLTLEVTEVRVERLQDISGDDVVAEGAWPADQRQMGRAHEAIAAYRDLWNSIHGKDAWDANPWVAVLTFRPLPASLESQKEGAADSASVKERV